MKRLNNHELVNKIHIRQSDMCNNLIIVPNLVESLPAGHDYDEARAVSTPKGALVLLERNLYLLVCNNNTCSWQKQSKQLDHDGRHAVMMVLPEGYSC